MAASAMPMTGPSAGSRGQQTGDGRVISGNGAADSISDGVAGDGTGEFTDLASETHEQ